MNARSLRQYAGGSILLCLIFATNTAGRASPLPLKLAPAAPFPLVLTVAATTEFVAPGVAYGEYHLATSNGPLQVHVISVDPRTQTIRLNPVLASDRLISSGETVSSMAVRTGAVAGINADYFDINNTYQPLGIVVRDGTLLRTPSKRIALSFTRGHSIRFSAYHFNASAQIQDIPVKLSAINEFPPEGGASLLTPAFGTLPSATGIMLAHLVPLSGIDPFGRYRIESVEQTTSGNAPGYALALGPATQDIVGTPNPGDVVTVSSMDPQLEDILAAVGGGPLLVHNGSFYDDPDAPALDERNARIPVSGAATQNDGTLLLLEIDGRQPFDSIGVTRPEFASLMRALGAREGMAFDGGGSSTLVTRRLGEPVATLRNLPSDGTERPVGDGLFVYSNAVQGPPSVLVVRPSTIRIIPGASVQLRASLTDAAGHALSAQGAPRTARAFPASLGTVAGGGIFTAGKPQNGVLRVQRGAIAAEVPVHIVQHIAQLLIRPQRVNPQLHARARFTARAYDRAGFPIILPAHLPWHATSGMIDPTGGFEAAEDNSTLSVSAGDAQAQLLVPVGRHEEPLMIGTHWTFSTIPAGNGGSLEFGARCANCIEIAYDFSGSERAAYMNGMLALPDNAVGLSIDVFGNGSGAALRAALRNSINERLAVTVAPNINWQGWRRREVFFPAAATPPLRLASLYVVGALGASTIHTRGSLAFRDVRLLVAGK
ncbi:MAG: phosphodiester glycosidase family protein [Candidatus Eremiobacteraeota bacterium]|nr:phosphodiester glycosidase family protein [Candidatus Eremiobacteraeota bacterium]